MKIKILKKLPVKRLGEFRELVLESLKNDPEAFGKTYLTEKQKPDSYWKVLLKTKKYLFLEDNGKLIGMNQIKYAEEKKFQHIVRLSGLYIKSEFRGQGLGNLLFKNSISEAFKNKKIIKIKLIVNKKQKNAIKMYRKYGFKIVGDLRKEFLINGKYFDAYLMELMKQ